MTIALALLLIAPTGQAMTMPPPAACPAAALPPELDGWSAAVPVTAAATITGAASATLRVGTGAVATLVPTAGVTLPVRSTRVDRPGSHAGLFAFDVARAGRYRVALGAGAWIDVVAGSTVAPSAAHGHGPDCSPVRKFVDFALQPGRYLLQVTGSERATLPLMIAALPG